VAVGWISLRLRGLRWSDVGFTRPPAWAKPLLLGAAAGMAMEALDLFVTKPLEARWLGAPPDLDTFRPLIGNVKLLGVGLVLAWVMAAVGEELAWRGYLLQRIAGLFGSRRGAWIAGVVLTSAVFGLAHAYQGASGVVQESLSGLMLGALFLAGGRSLAVPIIAHGVTDSIDLILICAGLYPGLHAR